MVGDEAATATPDDVQPRPVPVTGRARATIGKPSGGGAPLGTKIDAVTWCSESSTALCVV